MDFTITRDHSVPAFRVSGDGFVDFIRLNPGLYSALQNPEVAFNMAASSEDPTEKRKEAAANKAVVKEIFESAGIAMKETNEWFVILQNPADLGRAMEALSWPHDVRQTILAEAETIATAAARQARERRSYLSSCWELSTKIIPCNPKHKHKQDYITGNCFSNW